MALFRGDRSVPQYGNPNSAQDIPEAGGKLPVGPQVLQPGQQETMFRGYQPGDATIVRDKHVILNRGTERGGGRNSGTPDPLLDGPPRPTFRMLNRSFNPQQGTDNSRNLDDKSRGYRESRDGTWIGQQDGSVTRINGGVPGLYQPYGSYAGYTTGPVKGIQSPAEYGSPQDQPQVIPSSPPHGLHSATLPDYSQTLGRFMSIPQQRAGRADRPSNSLIAGQSYSQTVMPQGMTGTVAQQSLGTGPGGRSFPTNPGSGWRGA